MTVSIYTGDCVRAMRIFVEDASVQTCVTSPPYFGLRDYGAEGQIGLERTPDEYIAKLVDVFREVRRTLRDDGTLWLNIGDSYAGSGRGGYPNGSGGSLAGSVAGQDSCRAARLRQGAGVSQRDNAVTQRGSRTYLGLKPKDLIGIPWMLAFALRADGWHLRQDIIWNKPNPMPESVRDRCTKAHEYIFLLSKSDRYYFNADAIAEPLAAASIERLSQPTLSQQVGSSRVPGKTNGTMKVVGSLRNSFARVTKQSAGAHGQTAQHRPDREPVDTTARGVRNKRSVWTVTTKPFKGAHFATFPPGLIEPCILAGSPEGGLILDPFGGAGTTGLVAQRHRRDAVLCELNPEYAALAHQRIAKDAA